MRSICCAATGVAAKAGKAAQTSKTQRSLETVMSFSPSGTARSPPDRMPDNHTRTRTWQGGQQQSASMMRSGNSRSHHHKITIPVKNVDTVTLIRYTSGTVKNCDSGRAGDCRGPFCLEVERGAEIEPGCRQGAALAPGAGPRL